MAISGFVFPGQPAWSARRRAVELRWIRGAERASAWIPWPALEVLAGPEAQAHDAVRAVYLHRAHLEHAIEQKIRRRRTARGDVMLNRNDVWRATHAD